MNKLMRLAAIPAVSLIFLAPTLQAVADELPVEILPGQDVDQEPDDEELLKEAAANIGNRDYWSEPVNEAGQPFRPNPERGCPEAGEQYWAVNSKHRVNHIGAGSIFKGGPGGADGKSSMTASIQKNLEVKAAAGVATRSGEQRIAPVLATIVRLAELKWHLDLEVTHKRSETWSYTAGVPAGKYKNLHFGNWGERGTYLVDVIQQNCKPKTHVGKIKRVPKKDEWGYREWVS